MHVTLAPNRTIAKPAFGIHDNAEEEHPSLQFIEIFQAPDIHRNGINPVGSGAVRVLQASANGIQGTVFWLRPENSRPVPKTQRISQESNVEAGIELRLGCRRFGQRLAHAPLRTSVALPFTHSSRAPKPCLRIES